MQRRFCLRTDWRWLLLAVIGVGLLAGQGCPSPTPTNQVPTANAGLDQSVTTGATVTLAGSGTDPDGDTLTFSWEQTGGTIVTLSNADAATAHFTAPATPDALAFELTVSDGFGGTATDSVHVAVSAPPVTPQLFIANFTGNGILSYLDPSTINGNIAPDTNLSGPQTGLNHPADIVVTSSGVLLAANFGAAPASITSYPGAATANGNVVPARNVSGANTGLASPVTLAINPDNDLLFVANNAGTFNINVYAGASTAAFLGNLPPTRTIRSTALNHPFGINFGANDELYVANNGDSKILVFANASNLNGAGLTPSRTLTNPAFAGLFDCFVDPEDRLYVVNGAAGGNKILVIDNASTKNGAVTIDSTLTVTGAVSLTAIAVDKNQTGYIVDNAAAGGGAVYAYDTINTRNGAFAPDRRISGVTTQLSGPLRVFLVE
jgi:sugar lactone lactonase YvrE